MNPPPIDPEQFLSDSVVPVSVSQAEVRQWVQTAQTKNARRVLRNQLLMTVLFFASLSTIWVGIQTETQRIGELIKRDPSRAILCLQASSKEVLGTAAPEFFVAQLKQAESQNRADKPTSTP